MTEAPPILRDRKDMKPPPNRRRGGGVGDRRADGIHARGEREAAQRLGKRGPGRRVWLVSAHAVRLSIIAFLGLARVGVAHAQEGEEIEEAPITKLPEIIELVEAKYPRAALKQRIAAEVELEIEISETGTVSDIVVVRTTTMAATLSATTAEAYGIVRSSTITDYGFADAALQAVSRMSFSPAESEGIPIPVRVPYVYGFDLPPLPPLPKPSPSGPVQLSIRGALRERGTRSQIPGVVVTVFQQPDDGDLIAFEAVSNREGVFEFYDLPPGRWRIQGEADGYYPLRDSLQVVVEEVTEVTYYLEKGSYSAYDVFVDADRVQREVNRRTLSTEEIRTIPGTLGDPSLVVENLPGVARPAAGTGNIIVRGSGPADTGVFIDGVDVPIIFHFGGLKSVLPVDVVETVDFYPGNFSVFYGRGTGGVFDAHIRRLNPDQLHGTMEFSLLDVSLFAEVPLGENAAVAVGGRRSIIGDVISAVVPDDANAGVIAAPVYYDGQVLANWRPKKGHDLRFFFLASDDVLELLFENPTEADAQLAGNQVNTSINFQRATFEYRYAPGDEFQNTVQVALGRDVISFDFFGFTFGLQNLQAQLRETARFKVSDRLTLRTGIDSLVSLTDVEGLLPGNPPVEGQTGNNPDLRNPRAINIEDEIEFLFAPFIEAEWQATDRLSLVPGIRLDYFRLVDQWSFDPRIVGRYKILDKLTAKAGVGVVFQSPQPQEILRPIGNPGIGLQRGIQYSVGAEFALPKNLGLLSNLNFDLTLFYKDLDDLVTSSAFRDDNGDPLGFDNSAIGRVFGLEAFIEHKFTNNFRGWISYTLSRAERRDGDNEDFRLFDFDQTHIFNLVASYLLPENWEVGLRWRFVSGNPNTPSQTVNTGQSFFNDDIDDFANVPGDVNSARLPLFHQLDLRVEKGWIFDFFTLKAFLSIINTYNRGNPEGFNFRFDFLDQEFVTGLPVFPNIGVRAEF